MRLALYHPWIYLTGGVERVIAQLVTRSRHDWTVLTHHYAPAATFPELRDVDVRELPGGVSVDRSLKPLVHAATTIARTDLSDVGVDGLLLSSEGLGDLLMARTRIPTAVYCHTPLKIVHDPATRQALRDRAPATAATAATIGRAFTAVDRRMWRRFDHRFANSAETRDRIASAGLARVDEVEILRPAVDLARFAANGVRAPRRFLVAGRIMWQKRIELAIDAFRLAAVPGGELVIAGAVDRKSAPYLADLRARAADLAVRFVVGPSDAELTRLYATSTALVFTPPNEDFGIVPLEAMASGLPVLAADAGGVRETVAHGRTGWLLPHHPAAFADVLRRVAARGIGSEMRAACRDRAAAFDWDAFAARVDDVMEAVATRRTPPAPRAAVPPRPSTSTVVLPEPARDRTPPA